MAAGLFALASAVPAGAQWPPNSRKSQIVRNYDRDGDGFLNAAERRAARGLPATAATTAPAPTGRRVEPKDVANYPGEPLYREDILRTLFLDFEDADWERELAFFYHSDVDVPATLTVDGQVYHDVGVHFRGLTSYRVTRQGQKRSLGLSLDLRHKEQRLLGYRSMNLMNSNADPTFMRTALYHEIARQYIAAPKVNWVRVAVNGEDWGVYVNSQQFNSDFTRDYFNTTKGARWKVPGSPRGGGGLAYWTDEAADYKSVFEIKTKDDPKSWADLIRISKILTKTPVEQLEAAVKPFLDVDEVLRFLAIDNALVNNDGYWVRGSDYALYEDPAGRFHMIPQDANESLRELESMGRGGGGGGIALDPFGWRDGSAMLYRLLEVPALRERYLGIVREIAGKWLDWERIGPEVARHQALIAEQVKADTHKLDSTADFTAAVTTDVNYGGGLSGRPALSLKSFFEQRRAYLLNYPGIKRP